MTETLTHATTQPQPLAWAQAAGHCPVILSDTRPDSTRIGELLGIHAGKTYQPLDRGPWQTLPHPGPKTFTFGALVGVVRLVGVLAMRRIWEGSSREVLVKFSGRSVFNILGSADELRIRPWWRSGTKWGLLLSDAVLLPEPIPMRGSGGVWRIREATVPSSLGGTWQHDVAGWALAQWRKARGQ